MDEGTAERTAAARPRQVLVAEDDAAVLDLLVAALAGEGYAPIPATDGVAALEQVQRAVPDLVIADVHMPRLDGGHLARRLREWNVPVILLTADPNWARTPGAVYVAKPFDLDHLLAIVADLLDGEAAVDEGYEE